MTLKEAERILEYHHKASMFFQGDETLKGLMCVNIATNLEVKEMLDEMLEEQKKFHSRLCHER